MCRSQWTRIRVLFGDKMHHDFFLINRVTTTNFETISNFIYQFLVNQCACALLGGVGHSFLAYEFFQTLPDPLKIIQVI